MPKKSKEARAGAAPKEGRKSAEKAAVETNPAAVFANVVMLANRLASGAGDATFLAGSNLGLAEWLGLRAIATGPRKNSRFLSKSLGVSRQRVKQVVDRLAAAKLLDVTVPDADRRDRELVITSAGTQLVKDIDARVLAQLEAAKFPIKRLRHSGGTLRKLKKLLDQPGKVKGKGAGKAAKAVSPPVTTVTPAP